MKKKYAIKDIAEKSGVSIGTVDRVLHNRGRVSKKTVQKVKKVLEELDYAPNPIARSLKSNKVYKICTLVPDPKKDSYWEPCKIGMIDTVREFKGFDVEISLEFFDPSKPRSFTMAGNKLLNENLDALVFVPLFDKESERLLKKLDKKGVFSATFNSPPRKQVYQHVGQDLFLSGRVAAKLINNLSPVASKIAIVHIDEAFNNALHMQEKENGFRDFFCAKVDQKDILTLTFKTEEIAQGLGDTLKTHPDLDAFFVTTSKTFEVVKALDKIEKKGKIVGYDLLPQNIECLKKGTIEFLIHQAPKLQASLSLKNIIERLMFGKDFQSQQLLPIEIVNSENVKSYI
ncbi:substrate-binding domain-containing protein [Flagellimonas pacifica]|nr:substrate-binding domain-containing protein [Allomuricauda parva]